MTTSSPHSLQGRELSQSKVSLLSSASKVTRASSFSSEETASPAGTSSCSVFNDTTESSAINHAAFDADSDVAESNSDVTEPRTPCRLSDSDNGCSFTTPDKSVETQITELFEEEEEEEEEENEEEPSTPPPSGKKEPQVLILPPGSIAEGGTVTSTSDNNVNGVRMPQLNLSEVPLCSLESTQKVDGPSAVSAVPTVSLFGSARGGTQNGRFSNHYQVPKSARGSAPRVVHDPLLTEKVLNLLGSARGHVRDVFFGNSIWEKISSECEGKDQCTSQKIPEDALLVESVPAVNLWGSARGPPSFCFGGLSTGRQAPQEETKPAEETPKEEANPPTGTEAENAESGCDRASSDKSMQPKPNSYFFAVAAGVVKQAMIKVAFKSSTGDNGRVAKAQMNEKLRNLAKNNDKLDETLKGLGWTGDDSWVPLDFQDLFEKLKAHGESSPSSPKETPVKIRHSLLHQKVPINLWGGCSTCRLLEQNVAGA